MKHPGHAGHRDLLFRAKLLVEPSGATAAAALAAHRHELEGRTVVVVLSGGNADPADLGLPA